MKSAEIREKFLKFFEAKGHRIVPSSSLVPQADPTLLFTNAGMNQFKDVFLGFDKRPYLRATTAQKCVRAGGKHNDLENVGYTARHHTFFEMLGNFSFGDYFKLDAIRYAWELLVDVYGLPPDRLWVTVYAEDDEAHDIWTREIGMPVERVVRVGDNKGARYASDNFWMMGDTGPCGPCTEIFYDHGEGIPGGPPGSPDEDGDRYIEIWNNVFMQFNRDESGVMHPLPKPSVDTGMGLERMAAVLQHVHSNYEIDLFARLIAAAARETAANDLDSPSLRVLADHIRACSFLISDGVIPGNEGRGYVLRRIIRRAIRHGYKLGARAAFFHRLVPDLVAEMGAAYPELASNEARVTEVLRQEEVRFFETIEHGMSILEDELAAMGGKGVFNGQTAFKLHDTFGFPLDLTADVCRERGVRVDVAAFDAAMAQQKEQARAAGKFRMAAALDYSGPATAFHGYQLLEFRGRVLALYRDGSPVDELAEGDVGVVVLDETPFYAESGGQVGDRGTLQSGQAIFAVEDTQKIQASVFGHQGVVRTGVLRAGDGVAASVDVLARARTVRNHSATHLMHKALREVLGDHVQQKGSLVDAEKTRFDFAHTAPMTADEIRRVEIRVNHEILANVATEARIMPIEDARRSGAMMLFGEKYGDEVRVLTIGSSKELCGGVHVRRTGDIGLFKVIAETGIAAGVRRIEAVTGDRALELVQQQQVTLADVASAFKAPVGELPAKLAQVLDNVRSLEKELARLKAKLASAQGDDLLAQAVEVKGARVLAAVMEGADVNALRSTIDKLRDKLQSAAVVLASTSDGKVTLIAGVTANLTGRVKAGELVNMVAQQIGGRGGGRPDMAQGGGNDPVRLPGALAAVPNWVGQRL
ncbi:MAG TPA: alanine--tRNA ligase [Accumulibacter sp.]|uniref:alanine--tRNA ligase n=1 Tax=Accumulibacter sp. TaxID=2053492 RepID=UPI0025DC0683|nr:alanine--tRNA ligase [Accumulibacter sp.]MCM8600565.1 alanine--tRNA ligase [Accumulibacter sp.]MCM8664347.1 alanine--tRNA ligase [Accumulibacter sp.]HNC51748.1 alanine--tRNA ligase [Accumulibacter sp.]